MAIKIAVLENFTSSSVEKRQSVAYENEYTRGLDLALKVAKGHGYDVTYKYFLYGDTPLAVLSEMDDIKAWDPDFVIGPRASNQFIMLEDYLKDRMVISPMATSVKIDSMPINFQSLSLSSKYMGLAMFDTYQRFYPRNDVLAMTDVSCKNCQEVTEWFSTFFEDSPLDTELIEKNILSSSIATLNLSEFMSHLQSDTVFLLPDATNFSFISVVKVLDYLNRKTVFIGGDGWGDVIAKQMSDVKGLKANFKGLRVTFWPLVYTSKQEINFINAYTKMFNEEPRFSISFVVYQILMSVIDALETFPTAEESTQSKITASYQSAVSSNPYWYKSTQYAVYKTEDGNTNLLGVYQLPLSQGGMHETS